jgi:formate hydrogenlyase subunit 4
MMTISAWSALLATLVAAPIVPGVATRTRALLTGRRGSPFWQLYADLWKLAHRGIVYSTATSVVFRLAPVVLVATTVVAATLLPLDGRTGLLSFAGDAVAFAYLLALGRFLLVLAALDTGSSFEGMGASREVTFAALAEPGLFVALASLGLIGHGFSLSLMLGAAPPPEGGAMTPTLVMVAGSVFALALIEGSRVPVDDPATHLELTMVHEVMVLDHSGPDLALILYAGAVKLALFAAIIAGTLVHGAPMTGWLRLIALVGSFVALGVAIGVVESIMARLRLPKVPLYILGGSALALFGLILVLR